MGINLTLIGQGITFFVFILFTMKFVWPHVNKALTERQEKIAEGLSAAERSSHELELAKKGAEDELRKARQQAAEIVEQANRTGADLVERARADARTEAEREHATARAQFEQEIGAVRTELRKEVVTLALAGAGKILEREVDPKAHQQMLDQLAAQL